MQTQQTLKQLEDHALSMGQLDTIAAGASWPFGPLPKAPTTNINVNFDVDVINIKGNNNTISGRDSWIFNLFGGKP